MGTPGGAGGKGTSGERVWPAEEMRQLGEVRVVETAGERHVATIPRQVGGGVIEGIVNVKEDTTVTVVPTSLKGIRDGVDNRRELVGNFNATRRYHYDKVRC